MNEELHENTAATAAPDAADSIYSGIDPDTDREAMQVESYLEGMPWLNIGALFIPPIWGPAKGIWATILWYPAWMMADNCLYTWYSQGTVLATVTGIITLVLMVLITVGFARLSRPVAAVRAVQRGKTKEQFQHGERIWAIVGIVVGLLLLGFATYYNLAIRVPIAA